ncbi:MAG: ribosome biogenesis GTPase Der [Candidatus Desulfovibrio faecigallinarum]|uniref:ribosome biogenesis GTPase Der n=1 Tax=Desulfovibrio sp. An276 TaxID=1965618 RepID=UPI000B36E7B9|nr:ribosome biogenesis GTPase Der [Desulfovibrio sp. An276]MBU3831445.1 ribosome biogenesis GTPase Der [Candidatus Desulfovibrio faecigallinarum]OUO49349.1 ribosome biogenesis GTPase Der [Desulfovibrio sp. An276]
MSSTLPKVVLVGRPNVGKSTLFNRLIRSNRAITHDRPGVTRDRLEGIVRRKNMPEFGVIDTGGVTLDERAVVQEGPEGIRGFEAEILQQVHTATEEAAVLAFVVDGKDGLLPTDEYLADHLRRLNVPVLCVVNKVDGAELEDRLTAEFHSLGFPVLAVSAEHGFNLLELCDTLCSMIPDSAFVDPIEPPALRLAMLGRPNVGKSSLINALSGEKRMIVSNVAGTTRDSVDVRFSVDDHDYVFVDTAGVRRKTRITDTVEKYSANSSIKSAGKADVTLLTLDAIEGVSSQDKRLMDMLNTRKIPFVILINKSDLVPATKLKDVVKAAREMLGFCSHVPILTVSAKSGAGLEKILPLASEVHEECQVRVPTAQLNRAMQTALTSHQPPLVKGARPKFFYLTQAESEPPTFVFFVSDAERVSPTYARYLESSLRKTFQIRYAPMRVKLRSSHKKDK